VVDDEIGAKHIEEGVKVVAAQLNWRGREQQNGLGVVAKKADTLMQEGVAVADVMGFVDDDQVEFRRRVEGKETPILFLPLATASKDEIGIKQREG